MECQYDSGSMYGNVPICDRVATVAITYQFGHYGPRTVHVCDKHVRATRGRVFPDPILSERPTG